MSSTANQRKNHYLETEEGIDARQQLEVMANDPAYNTKSSYSPTSSGLTFVEKHLNHLSSHSYLKTHEYLANLKLMTKQRK